MAADACGGSDAGLLDHGEVVLGMPAQLWASLDARPAPGCRLGADHGLAQREGLRVDRGGIGGCDFGLEMREVPPNGSQGQRLKVDEQRSSVD